MEYTYQDIADMVGVSKPFIIATANNMAVEFDKKGHGNRWGAYRFSKQEVENILMELTKPHRHPRTKEGAMKALRILRIESDISARNYMIKEITDVELELYHVKQRLDNLELSVWGRIKKQISKLFKR
jgi:hypothetical protein